MKRLIDFLWIVFHPSYWIMNNDYSKSWDEKLIKSMAEYRFVQIDSNVANLGGLRIWIKNHPHGSFTLIGQLHETYDIRPSRITIRNAREKLIKDILGNHEA